MVLSSHILICMNTQYAFTRELAITSVEDIERTESKFAKLQLSFS